MKYLGKVDIVAEYDDEISSPSVTWKMPAVVRLRKEVRVHKRGAKFSREGIYARDKFTCQYCNKNFGAKNLTLDHVIPKSQGGRKSWDNIVTCCAPCNKKKANKTPDQSGMFPRNRPVKPKNLPLLGPSLKEENVPNIWVETMASLGISLT
jgi:5-methylcytosine-specific restriction endonuclease McrA